ncbi:hypothetical protein OS493_002668 [Desmophyllum pertusum]|uniref:Uncharacterized protein n=1 Tax=Desmophyllum pertusum TaxID=174260 RepID=A0A9W9YTE4_9CNID|nr:hypothetical protein OS493_002668 [Desmophyllum pertusum]
MVHCFAPSCDHHSESHTCKFFGFPNKDKKKDEYRQWISITKEKRIENLANTRECVAVILGMENKAYGPEVYTRNQGKIFPGEGVPKKKKKKTEPKRETLQEMIENAKRNMVPYASQEGTQQENRTAEEIILEAELQQARRELKDLEEISQYMTKHYTVSGLSADIIRMETGLPQKKSLTLFIFMH